MNNEYAVITGASSGIGKAFAHKFAAMGWNIILIARSEGTLQAEAQNIIMTHTVDALIIPADLSTLEGITHVDNELSKIQKITVLVNAAGFALRKMFIEQDTARQMEMITLHVTGTTMLTKRVLPSMITLKRGYIINVSSLLVFMNLANNSVHCATKAYLNKFSSNLQNEVKKDNIIIQALNPGYTITNFHNTEEFAGITKKYPKIFVMDAETVVEKSIRALSKRKVLYVPGLANKILVLFSPFFSAIIQRSLVSAQKKT